MDPYRSYVPIKIRRVDFTTDPPSETEETRYLFFNNYAFEAARQEAKRRRIKPVTQPDLERLQAGGVVDEEEAQDIQDRFAKQTSVFLWAGFMTQATQRGETLTPEIVGMWDIQEDQETLAAKIEEATAAYTGKMAKDTGASGDGASQGAEGNPVAATPPPIFSTSTATSTLRSSESVAKDFADGPESGFGRQP